jgi:hypothetical protein
VGGIRPRPTPSYRRLAGVREAQITVKIYLVAVAVAMH